MPRKIERAPKAEAEVTAGADAETLAALARDVVLPRWRRAVPGDGSTLLDSLERADDATR